jgi:hypothetical protein
LFKEKNVIWEMVLTCHVAFLARLQFWQLISWDGDREREMFRSQMSWPDSSLSRDAQRIPMWWGQLGRSMSRSRDCSLRIGIFHSHGGTPIAGWLGKKSNLKRMICGYPYFRKPPNDWRDVTMMASYLTFWIVILGKTLCRHSCPVSPSKQWSLSY